MAIILICWQSIPLGPEDCFAVQDVRHPQRPQGQGNTSLPNWHSGLIWALVLMGFQKLISRTWKQSMCYTYDSLSLWWVRIFSLSQYLNRTHTLKASLEDPPIPLDVALCGIHDLRIQKVFRILKTNVYWLLSFKNLLCVSPCPESVLKRKRSILIIYKIASTTRFQHCESA